MNERKRGYIPGSYLMVCDECGRTFRSFEMKKRWDNFWVCRDDWEPRHPQLDVRGRRDRIKPPVTRPSTTQHVGLEMLDDLEMIDDLEMAPMITPDDL